MTSSVGRGLVGTLTAVLILSACGEPGADGGPAGDGSLTVVATTAILGDVTAEIVGDLGAVETLMGPGADPHAFEPSPAQVQRLRESDLVVANGLQLEEGLLDALASARADGTPVVEVAPQVDPQPFSQAEAQGDDREDRPGEEHGDAEEHEHDGEDGEALDPHVWLDPLRMADGAEAISARLAEVAPGRAEQLRANGTAYAATLRDLHAELRETLSAVPEDRRVLVTNHDSLGYLAARYGFEVIGTVVPGGSTLADASSRDVAELVETMRAHDVTAIFVDTTAPDRLARAVQSELGESVEVVELFTGTLAGGDGDRASYVETMRINGARIAAALAP